MLLIAQMFAIWFVLSDVFYIVPVSLVSCEKMQFFFRSSSPKSCYTFFKVITCWPLKEQKKQTQKYAVRALTRQTINQHSTLTILATMTVFALPPRESVNKRSMKKVKKTDDKQKENKSTTIYMSKERERDLEI